ncbi:LOW QUALITY PROTEIN: hypothetical protein BDA96_09G233100 [Sorghum bicolor]|uniref:NB-ARC domain-containing protein n=1 Tax=Sorghum bicolor TaxID=4558 RepID=A0A921QC57_SORBI|nr:LOW QUALITY PROTEIN: hypothetical protein BDA96_09G233100 [Sorghum bicolor]
MDHSQWDDLLDALGSSCINGNVIIVTSRNLSVAKRLVCSIFPDDHKFHIDGLISMWISSGFVKSVEIGRDYLNALGNPDCASKRSCSELLRIPSNLVPSLKKMSIEILIKFQGNKEDEIDEQANGRWLLPCSLGVLDIRRGFPWNAAALLSRRSDPPHSTKVWRINALKSLQLHSCTALEKLRIGCCQSLDALEGFQSLRSLRYLDVYICPGLPQCLKSLSTQGYELCPRLERLRFSDLSLLTTPFCKHLTSLQCLQLDHRYTNIDVTGLTCEQEAALQLLTSLQELRFEDYRKLSDLPLGLHSLLSLKRLEIIDCKSISRLPQRGLPPSLEELEVCGCSELLTKQVRKLATSKLKVIINGNYVN